QKMLPGSTWAPFPPAADRGAWDALVRQPLNQQRQASLVTRAETLVGRPWPALPATLYMEFARNGNRSNFEQLYFERRANLATLVLAECMEHRGRFLDEIANGMWAITEEATWCLPAHASRTPKDVLHRQDNESVDLFAAETAMTLATARYLLRQELEALSPALGERVRREVLRRVVEPVASGDTFGSSWWLDGRNNWSPWCASNVLGAAMFLLDSPARLADLAVRMMGVADRFIDGYGEDGGCDEGPGYWDEAGGALLVFLELLHSRTDGAVDIYSQPKIAAMANFIVHAHIGGPWFLNSSDADAKTVPSPGKVYRFGERVRSAPMQNLALLAMRNWDPTGPVSPPLRVSGVSRALLGPLMAMFWIPADARPTREPLETTVWLPDLQMLALREFADAVGGGLYVAARGGHNAESHNHNDVGHFVVYLDNQPGIIDVGRETYTARTFSKDRYQLWFTRGSAHNTPMVNTIEQAEGRERKATQVVFRRTESSTHLAMNLEQAYPASAGIVSLRREVEFQRKPAAVARVHDEFALASSSVLQVPFYAAQSVQQVRPGRLAIDCKPRRLIVEYSPETFEVAIQAVPLEDSILRRNWGSALYRIVFELRSPATTGSYEFRFRAER
ncbi:MAG: heparinase II/III family protein, partial [Acidobacteria bacterium]|nr:heparinase II/III family protein [Acidobacteriota bacterium]